MARPTLLPARKKHLLGRRPWNYLDYLRPSYRSRLTARLQARYAYTGFENECAQEALGQLGSPFWHDLQSIPHPPDDRSPQWHSRVENVLIKCATLDWVKMAVVRKVYAELLFRLPKKGKDKPTRKVEIRRLGAFADLTFAKELLANDLTRQAEAGLLPNHQLPTEVIGIANADGDDLPGDPAGWGGASFTEDQLNASQEASYFGSALKLLSIVDEFDIQLYEIARTNASAGNIFRGANQFDQDALLERLIDKYPDAGWDIGRVRQRVAKLKGPIATALRQKLRGDENPGPEQLEKISTGTSR